MGAFDNSKDFGVMVKTTIKGLPDKAVQLRRKVVKAMRNPKEEPETFAAVAGGVGSAVTLGSAGALFGGGIGGAMGFALGVIPAIFTFGLSMPVGAAIGGSFGLALGCFTLGGVGLVGGATAGYGIASYREEIYRFLAKAQDFATKVTSKARLLAVSIKERSLTLGSRAKEIAGDKRTQVTAAGAFAGAATVGTAGAATGGVIGGLGGAAVGLVPAIFTFGLSIPVFAVLGAGCGVFVGGASGTALGFTGGGAAGFAGYNNREGIAKTASTVRQRAVKTYSSLVSRTAPAVSTN